MAALSSGIDYKTFQNFLTGALHAEDNTEAFKDFFSLFDTQVSEMRIEGFRGQSPWAVENVIREAELVHLYFLGNWGPVIEAIV